MSKLTTSQVAQTVGVHRDTLLRWLREGRVPEPGRDRRGWRVFSEEDVQRFVAYHDQEQPRERESPIERLGKLDWNFVNATTNYLTHGLHPYPAKFIPQIPNALIQELSCVGDTVLDPFCGSGTTLAEAVLLKRHAVGVDANPLACLISRAKTARLDDEDVQAIEDVVVEMKGLENRIPNSQSSLFRSEPFRTSAPIPDNKKLDFWFPSHVVQELAEIKSRLEDLPPGAFVVARTAFSSIIVAVSRQDSDTRYVRREKNIQPGDTVRRFLAALGDAKRRGVEFASATEARFNCKVFGSDILSCPDIGKVDLVVCSPPYPNAYSYHLYHGSRLMWLGYDPLVFKKQEIGSHRKYSSRGKNGATADTFRREMETVFRWLSRHVKPTGFVCFVVGDSTIRGETVKNDELVVDVASGFGFSLQARIDRQIQATRKAFNPAIGKIKTEKIVILQNVGRT